MPTNPFFRLPHTSSAERLPELAQFAFDHAGELCDPAHGCCSYHRGWSMVRLLLKGGALPAGGAFIGAGLAGAARDGRCRVLLSGSADTGLPALILEVLAAAGLDADLVIADRCATPIEQNRRFARHLGRNFELHRAEVQTLHIEPVDAILSHSLLNFVPAAVRPALVTTWARLLRPGGIVLIHQKLVDTPFVQDRSGGLPAFCARLETAAREFGHDVDAVARIVQAGSDFWVSHAPESRLSEADLRVLLEGAGLGIVMIERMPQRAGLSPKDEAGMSPDTPQSLVIARRPLAA
ncbi:MAG: class I SAM-dependent methyltransferase [Gemmobacter sp.]|nr:class I SAM-dependent methyltransferase [Gemmobacter sp.]